MNVDGVPYRSIWRVGETVSIVDQTRLPHELVIRRLATLADVCEAVRVMRVRGAPLIGAAAAYGLGLALAEDPSDEGLASAGAALAATRPTAVNLRWALERVTESVAALPASLRAGAALAEADRIAEEDVTVNSRLGDHGAVVLAERQRSRGGTLNVLTHCNAGWLATVDWGTALAPIYKAHDAGVPVHVWVDETRPRNQGALTAWELGHHGVPHTVIVDNAGGHLMQRGLVDLCITGTDRTTATGDVCNKIGTYLKALAAHAHGVPFYVALPGSTVDWAATDGLADIPIESRAAEEVTHVMGRAAGGEAQTVALFPPATPAANPAFDVTPRHLVTGLITERGVCAASAEGLRGLFPAGRPDGAPATPHSEALP